MSLEILQPGALLKLSQIVSYGGGKDRHGNPIAPYIGLVPIGRSKWLKLRSEGKIPQGRKLNPDVETSMVVWTSEEIGEVLEAVKSGKLKI